MAPIVQFGGTDIAMSWPDLNLDDIGFVLQGVLGVLAHQSIENVGADSGAGRPTAQRSDQWRFGGFPVMPRGFQVGMDTLGRVLTDQ